MTIRLAITGANGFVGRAVTRFLEKSGFDGAVQLHDQAFGSTPAFPAIEGDLCDPHMMDEVASWADCLIHLAALPGAAAAIDPEHSRRINLELPRGLMARMAGKRMVYASSVAVLGSEFGRAVNDATPPTPDSVYGNHKREAEISFADGVRSGRLTGLAIRLPGVVARPAGSAGFASAFLSDVFHAARAGSRYTLPVAPDATSWLISARVCAANLVHAALSGDSDPDAANMPALTVKIADLLSALSKGHDVSGIDHIEQPAIRRAFGSHPPLEAVRGQRLGMGADSDVAALVESVFADV